MCGISPWLWGVAMLESLTESSAAILAVASDLEQLVSAPQPDTGSLSLARFRLAKLGSARTKLLETRIYPTVLAHLQGADAEGVKRLREERIQGQARTSHHIGAWGPERIAADWRGYQTAMATLLARLRARIAAEQTMLSTMIAKLHKLNVVPKSGTRPDTLLGSIAVPLKAISAQG